MSVFLTLSLVAGGCLRRDGGFVLGAGARVVPPAGRLVPLTLRRTFRQLPDRWVLAIALGELWDAARPSAGDRAIYLRGRQDPDTGVTELDAVIIASDHDAIFTTAEPPSAGSPGHSPFPA